MSSFGLALDEQGRWVWRLVAGGQEIACSAAPAEHTTTTYTHLRLLQRGQLRMEPAQVPGGWTWKAKAPGGTLVATGRVLESQRAVVDEMARVLYEAADATIDREVPDVTGAPLFWSVLPMRA